MLHAGLQKMLSGDRLALARLISLVENRSPDLLTIMAKVQERCGHASVIGVTGPPGSGKSTLVDQLIRRFRALEKKVGVVAVDPSSPFSGGALLGDRIRMQDHAGDDGVFIRSLGSRGSRGGLSRATREVVKLYDAFGFDVVIVETVGVGQTELDIMEIAQTTIVLLTPESGDAIQTLKAGILEIADIFGVNKADREGADRMILELKMMLELGEKKGKWSVPVLSLQAVKGIGLDLLMDAIQGHQTYLESAGSAWQSPDAEEVLEIVLDELRHKIDLGSRLIKNPYLRAEGILKEFPWEKFNRSIQPRSSSLPRSNRQTRQRSARR